MRNAIKEYLEYTDEEKSELWENATFVFDTNVLLNLYRYSKDTRDALLNSMEQLKDRIWIPHQIAYEFMRNREETIYDTANRYERLRGSSEKFLKECMTELRLKQDDKEFSNLAKYIQKWISKKEAMKTEIIDSKNDIILQNLLELFSGRVGKPYDSNQLSKIEKEGKERYDKKIPPGYKDQKKDSNMYGDLILWKQIMDFALSNKVNIIFVTLDQKEDWWNILHKKTLGPRIELRKEFENTTKQRFHMYNVDSYLMYFYNTSGTLDQSVIDEVQSDETTNLDKLPNNLVNSVITFADYLKYFQSNKETIRKNLAVMAEVLKLFSPLDNSEDLSGDNNDE